MALSYASPGVYVEEVDRGTKPIEAVGTSTAAFIGITAEASLKAIDAATGQKVVIESRLNKATLVTSWTQFTEIFGEFVSGAYLPDAVYGYFSNGGGPCYVTSLRALNESAKPAGRSRGKSAPAPAEGAPAEEAAPAPLSPLTAADLSATRPSAPAWAGWKPSMRSPAGLPGRHGRLRRLDAEGARQDGPGRDDLALRAHALSLRRAGHPARPERPAGQRMAQLRQLRHLLRRHVLPLDRSRRPERQRQHQQAGPAQRPHGRHLQPHRRRPRRP
jgi:hypothetical protein